MLPFIFFSEFLVGGVEGEIKRDEGAIYVHALLEAEFEGENIVILI